MAETKNMNSDVDCNDDRVKDCDDENGDGNKTDGDYADNHDSTQEGNNQPSSMSVSMKHLLKYIKLIMNNVLRGPKLEFKSTTKEQSLYKGVIDGGIVLIF